MSTRLRFFKLTIFIIGAFCIMRLFASFKNKLDAGCAGEERWDVKTLCDSLNVKKINFTPKTTTIPLLTTIPPPSKIGNHLPRTGVEFQAYEIECIIREYRIEDDGDYHLVLVDLKDSTKTMIGEIPNPNCDKVKNSPYLKTFMSARADFEKVILPGKGYHVQKAIFSITGIAFFDKPHGQLGRSSFNSIELHPIMSIFKEKDLK